MEAESVVTMVIDNHRSPPPTPARNSEPVSRGRGGIKKGRPNKRLRRRNKEWIIKKREALMVAAAMIAGITFQVAVNPPGGIWDADTELGNNETALAGTARMAYEHPQVYKLFIAYNTASFVASLSIVFLVVSGVPLLRRRILTWILMIVMWITLTFMALSYLTSVWAISPLFNDSHTNSTTNNMLKISRKVKDVMYKRLDIVNVVVISMLAWVALLAVVALVHVIRALVWCVRKEVLCVWKQGKVAMSGRSHCCK